MKLAIIGVGAMGCLFAARLAPISDLVMLGNWPEQIKTLRNDGIVITELDGKITQVSVKATNDPGQIGPVDLALILVKSRQTERAAAQAREFLSNGGIALTLQNGLGNIDKLANALGWERVALGVTAQGATVLGPGRVRHAGQGPTHMAQTPQTEELLSATVDLFRRARLETHLTDDVAALAWGKLAINTAINPLTAILRVPNGFLAQHQATITLMGLAAEETAAVARAQGIQLPFTSAAERACEVAEATAANFSSMLQDVMRGVPTEIEAICGQVIAHGRRLHVETPVNEELLRLVKAVEERSKVDIPPNSPLATISHLLPSHFSGGIQ